MLRVLPPALSSLSLGAIASGLRPDRRERDAGLQRALERRTGARAVLLDCGTSALRLAIRAVAARAPGRPVALPAWACYDIVSAGMGSGAPLAFYDVDPLTLQPAAGALAALGTSGAAGIVIVHAFGVPVDVRAVRAALPAGTPVIEDAAQAWGTTLDGAIAGSMGDLALYSFGRGKGITGGSGGALLVREPSIALPAAESTDVAPGWKDIAACAALWTLARPAVYGIPSSLPFLRLGETRYHAPHDSAPMTPVARAIVLASLAAADRAAEGRRATAGRLAQALAGAEAARLVSLVPGAAPGWLRFPLLARDRATRDALVARGRALGFAEGYPQPLTSLARTLGVAFSGGERVEGAEALAARLFTVPTHEFVAPRDIARIAEVVSGG